MNCLEERIGNSKQPIFNMQNTQDIYYTNFGDDIDDDVWDIPYGVELLDMETKEVDKPYLEELDEYINVQVVLPNKEDIPVLSKVKKRKRGANNQLIGEHNANPILDTWVYELEFPDGATS